MLWIATLLVGERSRTSTRTRGQSDAAAARVAGRLTRLGKLFAAPRTVLDSLHRYRVRRAAVRQLNTISDHLLSDIGMTRADIQRVARDMSRRRDAESGEPAASTHPDAECCAA